MNYEQKLEIGLLHTVYAYKKKVRTKFSSVRSFKIRTKYWQFHGLKLSKYFWCIKEANESGILTINAYALKFGPGICCP